MDEISEEEMLLGLYSETMAPTRDPETIVAALLRAMPRLCCDESQGFDASETYFYIDRSVTLGIVGIWLVLMGIYSIWALARRWCWSCQRSSRYLSKNPFKKSHRQRLALGIYTITAIVIFAGCTIYARRYFSRATNRGTSTSEELGDVFSELEDLSRELQDQGEYLDTVTLRIDCDDETAERAMRAAADILIDEADDILIQTQGTDATMTSATRRAKAIQNWLDLALVVSVFIVALIIPSIIYGCILSKRWALNLASKTIIFIATALALGAAIIMGVGVSLSDFCWEPDLHFRNLVEEKFGLDDDAEQLLLYYTTCQGLNPISDDIITVQADILALNATVNTLIAQDSCRPTSSLFSIRNSVNSISNTLDFMIAQLDCKHINDQYQKLVHSALCRSCLSGSYYLAVAYALVAAMLFVLLFAINWVCETILLEEEFSLLPHPEIFNLTAHAHAPRLISAANNNNMNQPQQATSIQPPQPPAYVAQDCYVVSDDCESDCQDSPPSSAAAHIQPQSRPAISNSAIVPIPPERQLRI
mmetsp:Transcript_22428/g.29059  ORF Transcript_22428/g.29059 Transcript_22428/m.29059 type:complete len:534 (+) Transcript_22428:55-1656(+)